MSSTKDKLICLVIVHLYDALYKEHMSLEQLNQVVEGGDEYRIYTKAKEIVSLAFSFESVDQKYEDWIAKAKRLSETPNTNKKYV